MLSKKTDFSWEIWRESWGEMFCGKIFFWGEDEELENEWILIGLRIWSWNGESISFWFLIWWKVRQRDGFYFLDREKNIFHSFIIELVEILGNEFKNWKDGIFRENFLVGERKTVLRGIYLFIQVNLIIWIDT